MDDTATLPQGVALYCMARWLGALHSRRLYQAVFVLPVLLSITVLWQVHRDGGVAGGAYGVSYREQMRQRAVP